MPEYLRDFYASRLTFLDMLLECSQFLDQARRDPGSSKMDVLDSLEQRLSLLVGKLASQPTAAAFAIIPAPLEEEEPEF